MKTIFALAALLILSTCARAQVGNTTTIPFPGAPTGGCSFNMFAKNVATGDLYSCGPAGSWVIVSSGGGGVTSVGLSAPTGFTVTGSPVTTSGSLTFTMNAHGVSTPLACADSSGSGTAQSCTTSPSFTPASGDAILYSTTTVNTGDITINVNSTSAKHVRKWSATAVLAAYDLPANIPVVLVYDGTYWEINTLGNSPAATPINVVFDNAGSSTIGTCTLTFAQGSQTATASTSTCFTYKNIGAIIQYNSGAGAVNYAGGANVPFRVVVVSVAGANIGISAPFPGPSGGSGAITYDGSTSGQPAAGEYNIIADACGQIQASLYNHQGQRVDASGFGAGPLNCTVSPPTGAAFSTAGGIGGQLMLGYTQFNTSRTWTIPASMKLRGMGRGPLSPTAWNTQIQATNSVNGTSFGDQNNLTGASLSGVTSANNVTSWVDTNAVYLVSTTAATAGCDTGNYGHYQLSSGLQGVTEDANVTLAGWNTSSWNNVLNVVAVSGSWVEVQFNATCVSPTGTLGTTDTTSGNTLQAVFTGPATGTISSWTQVGMSNYFTDTAGTFTGATSGDVGSCAIVAASGAQYTIASFTNTTTVTVGTPSGSAPTTTGTWTETCYVQSDIASTTNGTTLVLTNATQYAATGATGTYTIGNPVMQITPSSPSIQATEVVSLQLLCNGLAGCGGFNTKGIQEWGRIEDIGIGGWSTWAMDLQTNVAHSGPFHFFQAQSVNPAPVTASCVQYIGTGVQEGYGIDNFTCIGPSTNGGYPFVGFEMSGQDFVLSNWHCERCIIGMRVNKYNTARGFASINGNPGISNWDGVQILAAPSGGKYGGTLIGTNETNAIGHDIIEDQTISAACVAGTTTDVIDLGSNFIAQSNLYTFRYNGTSHIRFSDDPSIPSCLLGTPLGIQALGTISGGTATATMAAGNTVTMTLSANLTTLTINGAMKGQQMDLIIVENGTGGFTVALPGNFKNATAATTTANSCNAYHMVYDGTNWIQEGFTTSTNGGATCL